MIQCVTVWCCGKKRLCFVKFNCLFEFKIEKKIMFKLISPCCYIPPRISCWLVAIFDCVFGLITIFVWTPAIINFQKAQIHLKTKNISEDVAWYGIISIPLIACYIGVWSGLKLGWDLYTKKKEFSHHVIKAIVVFIVEVIGFITPFFIFDNYILKIDILLNYSMDFYIFNLLKVNIITIVLFIYQQWSFWIVQRYEILLIEKSLISKQRLRKYKIQQPLLRQNINNLECPINEQQVIAVKNSTENDVVSKNKIHQTHLEENRNRLYPNLKELILLPTPTYKYNCKVEHIAIDILDHHSEANSNEAEAEGSTCLNVTLTDENTMNSSDEVHEKMYQKSHIFTEFEILKKKWLKRNVLYVDKDFPPNDTSIGTHRLGKIEWKRPNDIVNRPKFFTDGISRFDVKQGELGDCWFLAAVANLTLNHKLFANVVPYDNEWSFERGTYGGMCHFRFWVKDKWVEIIIDDHLPTKNGQLIFMSSSDKTEFWSALLEKAYAKLNGSYMNLNGNDGIGRAMINLTGGHVERYHLKKYNNNLDNLYELIKEALKTGKMLGCASYQNGDYKGIQGGHAYSITHVKTLQLNNDKIIPCIRIRNPWGNKHEWSGDFSDGHPIWEHVNKKTRIELEVIFKNDGEFWFPIKELTGHFDLVEICHL